MTEQVERRKDAREGEVKRWLDLHYGHDRRITSLESDQYHVINAHQNVRQDWLTEQTRVRADIHAEKTLIRDGMNSLGIDIGNVGKLIMQNQYWLTAITLAIVVLSLIVLVIGVK